MIALIPICMDTDSASCTDAHKVFQYTNIKFPLSKEEKSYQFSNCVNFIYSFI